MVSRAEPEHRTIVADLVSKIEGKESVKELYERYAKECESRGLPPRTYQRFHAYIKDLESQGELKRETISEGKRGGRKTEIRIRRENEREELKRRIEREIAKGNNILLKGKHGIGKSYIAEELAGENEWIYLPFCKPAKAVLMQLMEELLEDGRDNPEYKAFKSEYLFPLCDRIVEWLRSEKKNIVIVLDEVHTITPQAASAFNYLIRITRDEGLITWFCIATDQYLREKINKAEMKRFFWELKEIEMEQLTGEASYELLSQFEKTYKVRLRGEEEEKIVRVAKGNPLEMRQQVMCAARDAGDSKEWIKEGRGGAYPLMLVQKGAIKDQAVNLFPFVLLALFVVAAARWLFRGGMAPPELAGLFGFFGLLIMYMVRVFFFRKEGLKWR
ncbi:MAG: hypothetical protein QMD80_04230 [archaeon]|nr:hypothetical protein [archaeon]